MPCATVWSRELKEQNTLRYLLRYPIVLKYLADCLFYIQYISPKHTSTEKCAHEYS